MPSSEFAYHPGDVVVVPFPYADRLAEKRRPALVISASTLLGQAGLLWVAMITSRIGQPWPYDVSFNHETAGLPAPSLVRSAKLATIEPDRVVRVAGKLDAAAMKKVMAAIKANLA